MTTRVKICGIKTDTALAAALEARADLVGFVFFPPSPRYVTIPNAQPLAEYARGLAASVALVVDADDALVDAIIRDVRPDMLQLHGNETPDRVAEVRARSGKPVMKAIRIETETDAAAALAYRDIADVILFDARTPAGSILPGGNGLPFDWSVLSDIKDKVPFMLSGGLTPDNVAEAIRLTGAVAVDVSSGVERSPGEKDPDLIRRFIGAAKSVRAAA